MIRKQSRLNDLIKNIPIIESWPDLYRPPAMDRKTRKKVIRFGLLAGNIILLAAVGVFVIYNRSASHTVRSSALGNSVNSINAISHPLDQVSSAQIALQAAQMTKLPELTAVKNQADSERALLSIVPSDTTTLSKPQVVSTAQKSKSDIIHYTVQNGDTMDSLASKFHVTSVSITASNTGVNIKPGNSISIPPGNGLIYKVKSGDTVNSIVNRYGVDKDLFIAVNDAESGLNPGDEIWIPNAVPQATRVSYTPSLNTSSFAPTYGYNGYDYGYCTYYAAAVISVPNNWGNANTWDDYARRTPGWTVGLSPVKGAIAQTDAGWAGHVAVVEDVSPDGSTIKYSDMNGLAGWGRVGKSWETGPYVSNGGWAPASHFQHFIYHQ